MSLVIRLTKVGRKGEARYRVVVKERKSKRDGKAVEILGWYEKGPNFEKQNVNKERYSYWISKGGKPSPTVAKIVEKNP